MPLNTTPTTLNFKIIQSNILSGDKLHNEFESWIQHFENFLCIHNQKTKQYAQNS
jgi:hypothetical protein